MLYTATINYTDGSKGSTEVEVRYEYKGIPVDPFISADGKLWLSGVIREDSDNLLTNYGQKLTDGWQAIHRDYVESITVGPYIWYPTMTVFEIARRDMLTEIERAFS